MPNETHPAPVPAPHAAAASGGPEPAGAAGPEVEALLAARQSAIVADLALCAVLAIDGPDAAAFLQGQLSNDVAALTPERCQYTSYNSPKGRVLANLVLWQAAPQSFRALLPAELADGVARRLRMYVLRSKVTITELGGEAGLTGVGGPAADTVLAQALGVAPAVFGVAEADGATLLSLPGRRYVVVAPNPLSEELRDRLARHARPAGAAVWRWLTVDAGVPVVTAATQEQFVLQALNWEVLGGVSFHKGCYPGQEIVARTRYLGRLKERLYALHTAGPAAPGARIFGSVFGDQACGTVVNAAPAPEGGTTLLAVVQIAAAEARDLRLGAVDGPRLDSRALPYAVPPPAEPRR
jgi:folate-binding protein YgfZ